MRQLGQQSQPLNGVSKSPPSARQPVDVVRPSLHSRPIVRRHVWFTQASLGLLGVISSLVPWAIGMVALFVLGAGLCLGWQRAARSAMLQVRHIDVIGGHRTTRQEILTYTGAELHQPMLALKLDAMALRLRQHPWVSQASIRRQLPDRLHIQIVEHEPVLLVSLGDLYLANAQGQLFKRFEAQDHVNLPVVTGIDREGAVQHGDDVAVRLRTAQQLAVAVAHLNGEVGRLEEIHWDDDLGWNIVLQQNNQAYASCGSFPPEDNTMPHPAVRAQLGHAPVDHLPRAVSALRVLADGGQAPDVIWADGDRTPDRVPVELLADGAVTFGTGRNQQP